VEYLVDPDAVTRRIEGSLANAAVIRKEKTIVQNMQRIKSGASQRQWWNLWSDLIAVQVNDFLLLTMADYQLVAIFGKFYAVQRSRQLD
jgi:hypothetical protein